MAYPAAIKRIMHATTAKVGTRMESTTPKTTTRDSRMVMQGWQHPAVKIKDDTRTNILKKWISNANPIPAATKQIFAKVMNPSPNSLLSPN
mmetsp:Transcript_18776/g.40869  ORF Transcript_18776/g.40869 Transcript_18776/m.40869 type:complete len:91 (-) Transcript_18776:684-956(-)